MVERNGKGWYPKQLLPKLLLEHWPICGGAKHLRVEVRYREDGHVFQY